MLSLIWLLQGGWTGLAALQPVHVILYPQGRQSLPDLLHRTIPLWSLSLQCRGRKVRLPSAYSMRRPYLEPGSLSAGPLCGGEVERQLQDGPPSALHKSRGGRPAD
ncbi:hypothetical protein BD289DRAFT_438548 [Coniella lustricola]|uniref:Uncharacterized protein n=1 Tax=Coniella lustricola TaxID=2025994 RepID=A0A2T3A2U4_9PEZI|nr:hypothetical protein BD289DRAFT_438548 [Coniella lustricola]